MKLYLDIDGVCGDLVSHLAAAHGLPLTRHDWPATYDLSVPLGKSQDDIWNHPRVKGSEFWATVPKLPWADDLVNALRRRGEVTFEVTFLTHPVRDPWSAAGKVRWIQEHYPAIPYLIGPNKVGMAHAGAVLIDDHTVNVAGWRAGGGEAVLFPAPWNELAGMQESNLLTHVLGELDDIERTGN